MTFILLLLWLKGTCVVNTVHDNRITLYVNANKRQTYSAYTVEQYTDYDAVSCVCTIHIHVNELYVNMLYIGDRLNQHLYSRLCTLSDD